MRTSLFNAFVLVLTLSLIFPPGLAKAYDYEAYKQAVTATENAAAMIRMAEGAVGQVLMEAMSGKYGELHKWSLIDEKMTALGTTIDSSLSQISNSASVLFSADPNYRLPGLQLGHPFEGNLNMARSKKRELLELAKQESAKLQKLNDMIAKVDKALYNATKGAVGDTIEGFLPSEAQLGGEAAVIVLGAYFGPPGIVVAGLGVFASFTVNTVVSLYYNSKALADQIKALTPMKEMLEANKRTIEQNVTALNQAAQEMLQIEQVLDKQQKKLDGYSAKISKAEEDWGGQSQSAYQAKQADLVEQAKKQAAALNNPINLSSWAYGMSPIPPIQPGEYTGDIASMVAQMDSYSKAVEDGGEPDNFSELLSNWDKSWMDKYRPLKEEYDKKYADYQAASNVCWQQINAAYQRFRAASDALWAAYRNKSWDDAARAASASISAAYSAAEQAAYAGLMPHGQALIAPYREMTRLSHVRYGVENAYSNFRQRVEGAVTYRSNEFWREFEQWRRSFEEATIKTGPALSKIPYYSKSYKNRADNIDSEITQALYWGTDVMSLRDSLLSTSEQLKKIGSDVKEGVKEYEEAMLDVRRVINVGQSELETYIARYGKLINHPRAGRYYLGWYGGSEEFVPNTSETDARVKWLSEYVVKNLNYEEPSYIEEAKKTDWEGLARIYKEKADEYTSYVDWAEQYLYRQSVAAGRLDRISREMTGLGFYATRGTSVIDTLIKEFSESQWASISVELQKYVSESSFKKLPWAQWQPWDGMSLWQKLYAAQTILLYRINDEMKSYVQSRANGGFFPVQEDIIKPIEENWKGLRALCEKYDALAKPLREKVGNAPEEANKEIMEVWDVWNRMPQLSRNLMVTENNRFRGASDWLNGYLRYKVEVFRASILPPNNSVSVQLDNLITSYRPELEKWQERQRKMQEEYERQRREWEAEQARIKAEEERKRQEEQKKSEEGLLAVRSMYDSFRQAYESKNDSKIMSFMGDDWEAGDGTTLSDLQVNLSRSFRIFDEVRYNIQSLNVQPMSGGKYAASYDVTITSRIYSRNIKHEEKSSVNEEVTTDGSGKPRITRTMNGRFWYVE